MYDAICRKYADGNQLFESATKAQDFDAMDFLLKEPNLCPDDATIVTEFDHAINMGYTDVVKFLFPHYDPIEPWTDEEAEISYKNDVRDPLLWAAFYQRADILEFLLAQGTEADAMTLNYAIRSGCPKCTQIILDAGVDPNVPFCETTIVTGMQFANTMKIQKDRSFEDGRQTDHQKVYEIVANAADGKRKK